MTSGRSEGFADTDHLHWVADFWLEEGCPPAVKNLETVAGVSHFRPAARVRVKRPITVLYSNSADFSLIVLPKPERDATPAIVLVQLKVQVGGITRMLGLFPQACRQQPANESAAARVVVVASACQ